MLTININTIHSGDSPSARPISLTERIENTPSPKFTSEEILKARKQFNEFIFTQISTELEERMNEEKDSISW
ncbi:hypothetical protein ASE93_01140 [Serratia sp. Leaf50]|nr:hypothetical protein ASE93_01140 [Serratia sp. Leaf50]